MKKRNGFLTLGLAIIFLLIAIVVLVDILGFLKANDFLGQYWPILLILVGLLTFTGGSSGESGFSFGLIMLGLVLLLNVIGVFDSQIGKTILVVLLGLGGISILVFAVSKTPTKPTSKDR